MNKLLCSALVAKTIDDEPELPGDMPDELWQSFKMLTMLDDKESMTELLRGLIKLTKKSIKEELEKIK